MDIKEVMNENKELVDNAILRYIPTGKVGELSVNKAMKYAVVNGGKRLRPLLVHLFAQASRGSDDFFCNDDLPFACAIEMIHSYSLIHDDLPCMDNDDMRRGLPSCHKKFGEDVALLAGDGLLTLAFETITNEENIKAFDAKNICKIVNTMSKCSGIAGMIGGQIIDLENEKKTATIEEITTVNLLKTGALIKAACLIGCYLGNASEEQLSSASLFADKLGIAFQIQDDILDVVGDSDTLGKLIGSDAANNKSTYVSILGMEKSKEIMLDLTSEAIGALSAFGENATLLSSLADVLVARQF